MPIKKINILFLINGLGMGNSTRCYAIIERLVGKGVTVDVMTSKNGLFFFSDKKEINRLTELENFFYATNKNGKLSAWKTFLSFYNFFKTYKKNQRIVSQYIKEAHPSLVVTDSEYIFWPMKRNNIPIVAINNSNMVVYFFFRIKNKPINIFPQFFLIEYWDYLFHFFIPHRVISPSIMEMPILSKKFISIHPISRRGCTRKISEKQISHVSIMLSGSGFAPPLIIDDVLPFHIDVIGQTGKNSERVTFHGKVLANLDIINRADILVINCGFSAISEGISMQKPLVLIPIQNHAEQYINHRFSYRNEYPNIIGRD